MAELISLSFSPWGDHTHLKMGGRTVSRYNIVQYRTINNFAFGSRLLHRLCCYRSLRKRRQRNRDTISSRSGWYLWRNSQNPPVFRALILLFVWSFVNRPNKWTLRVINSTEPRNPRSLELSGYISFQKTESVFAVLEITKIVLIRQMKFWISHLRFLIFLNRVGNFEFLRMLSL